ncbi:MAG: ribulose-phosphate 3-epimerase [Acholeplasmataceae bacterium]|nr:ribulose-phosphate 3-epimerase [Acholeplasmataceae bacterium]HOA64099.1 ribulose-phosphate 3-epimerase [Bacilli bacterium]HQA20092.1 ribulose-phosphate 3-epimerase [Bacilli bacterium]HQD92764.1 ribulose-phosphate 3-epimerase [Bacilli bacterium]
MAIVAPSILSANFAYLLQEVQEVYSYGAQYLHIDVMDGHFVPNITLGPTVFKHLRPHIPMVFDVHLMITNPQKYIKDFVQAGADVITFHFEAVSNIKEVIELIKSYNIKAGLSIKPHTDVRVLEPYLGDLDLILVMSVEPGFGGQKFMPIALDKIRYLKTRQQEFRYLIEVDGGINQETGKMCVEAGADILVAGNYIFTAKSRKEAVESLLRL